MKKLLFVALASALAFSSAAQTGRIAHYSHGGNAATLEKDEWADNFGTVPKYFRADSARLLGKNIVVFYGKWMGSHLEATTDTLSIGKNGDWHSVKEIIEAYEDNVRPFKLINFEPTNLSDKAQHSKHSKKALKPTSGKPSGQTQAFPKRPFQYSYWHGLAGAAALGAVGWLLGKKRTA